MATWSEKKAKEKLKKDYEDEPSRGRKVTRPKVDNQDADDVYRTTAHQVKRDAALEQQRKGRRA